jgi:predicted nucleic acid-binding protein
MAATVVVDTSFLVTLISRREANHQWAIAQSERFPPPWQACDAVLSETFHLLGPLAGLGMTALLRRGAVSTTFRAADTLTEVLGLMQKYADVPMSFADACLVRMTELLSDPVLLTTDADFRVYRRHSRQVVPCVMPG